ncbi:hypothetical protein CHARACLAT_021430 [Characodon lateralis]|uniref:Uncharacterized protein n=1 Tax=Characodon lateralis TaxID=208331 RepID=A0ABU7DMF6_9TELE|nr:hypothetical protein [Characodon lateralis]
MIKSIYALWISYPISCLHLDSHQAGSFLLPPSPGPNPSKEPPTDSPSSTLDPESPHPWRPDHSYLLEY